MLAGIPVVLPDSGAFPEIIETTKGGKLYDPTASAGLKEALDEMLSDPKDAKLMGMKAHRAVLEKYANEKLAKMLVEEVVFPLPVNK